MSVHSPDPSSYSPAPSTNPRRVSIRQLLSRSAVAVGTLACVLITTLGISIIGGFLAGQKERDIQATQTTVAEIDLQYRRGVSELEQGNYRLAAHRFRWILERDPGYPGAAEYLDEAEMGMAQIIPTSAPTLPPSSSRDPEELFGEAKTYYERQEWANAISRFNDLQALDSSYREIEVKEMLYTALTTLGLTYIRGDRIEEGLLLLGQAEEIHPLDDQTAGERYLATLYSTGQIYWNLNWQIVIDNFQAIYDLAPNYRNIADRLWEAYVKYGDQLALQGAYCTAALQYEGALNLQEDRVVLDKMKEAQEFCENPTPIPTATLLDEMTRTPEGPTGGSTDGRTPDDDQTGTPTPSWNIP